MTDEPHLALSELRCSCPFCRHDFQRAVYVAGRLKPGALALCPYCGEVSEVGANLELKKASDESLLKIKPEALRRAKLLAEAAKKRP